MIEDHSPPEKIFRVQIAKNEVGIGDGWLLPSKSVTDRPGLCACTVRSYLEKAHLAHLRDAPASCPDLHQIHHGYLNGKAASLLESLHAPYLKGGDQSRISLLDETRLGRGPPHIKTEYVREVEHPPVILGGDHSSSRPRFDDPDRKLTGRIHGGDASAR